MTTLYNDSGGEEKVKSQSSPEERADGHLQLEGSSVEGEVKEAVAALLQ